MSEETKTAEETTILDIAIQEIERQKFSLIENKTPATKVGLTDALSVLKFLKDEHYIKCECGHTVEHKFSHTNEDGEVSCSTCLVDYQHDTIAELKKQNAEAFKLIKDFVETYREGLCSVVDIVYLLSEKFISENTPPKN